MKVRLTTAGILAATTMLGACTDFETMPAPFHVDAEDGVFTENLGMKQDGYSFSTSASQTTGEGEETDTVELAAGTHPRKRDCVANACEDWEYDDQAPGSVTAGGQTASASNGSTIISMDTGTLRRIDLLKEGADAGVLYIPAQAGSSVAAGMVAIDGTYTTFGDETPESELSQLTGAAQYRGVAHVTLTGETEARSLQSSYAYGEVDFENNTTRQEMQFQDRQAPQGGTRTFQVDSSGQFSDDGSINGQVTYMVNGSTQGTGDLQGNLFGTDGRTMAGVFGGSLDASAGLNAGEAVSGGFIMQQSGWTPPPEPEPDPAP